MIKCMKTQISTIEKPFSVARQKFDQLCESLESVSTFAMTHGERERYIEKEGTQVMRQLFQDSLDLQSIREKPVEAVIGQDKVKRRNPRQQKRTLETIFGSVVVSRLGYGKADKKSVHPLDAELNLPQERYSHGLRRLMAKESGQGSYAEAIEAVESYSGGHIPKRQAEELVIRAAVDFDEFYAQAILEESDNLEIRRAASLLILTVDQKGIVMRPEDLRPATQKAALKSRHKLAHRLSPGEKRNRKRMASVASVYSIAPDYRTSCMVAENSYPQDRDQKKPKPVGKRVWASIEKSLETVVKEVFEEGLYQDPRQEMEWVALVDGNRQQIDLLEKVAKHRRIKLRIVLDVIHVLDYLWKAAYAFCPAGSQEAQSWVNEKGLMQGKSSLMAASMRRQATRLGLSAKERESVDDCAQYLLNNTLYLRYHTFVSRGYPIATGVIEGACRHLVKDRMDRTGARWSLQGAEAVLKMRALLSSGDFEEYWEFHEQQESSSATMQGYGKFSHREQLLQKRGANQVLTRGLPHDLHRSKRATPFSYALILHRFQVIRCF